MSQTKFVLDSTLHSLIVDAQLILHDIEQGRVPSYDLKGTFKVNCEVSLKKLQELREEDL